MENYLKFIETVGFKLKPDDGKYYECHHIVPRCMGGLNNKENLIYLSYKHHLQAHILLSELFPENVKLAFAVNALYAFTDTGNRDNSIEELEKAKLTFINNHPAKNPEFAKKFSGENSPMRKNASTREKMSLWQKENSLWRGKTRPEHSIAISGAKNGRAKQLVTPDGVFNTIIEASKSLSINRNKLARMAADEANKQYYFVSTD